MTKLDLLDGSVPIDPHDMTGPKLPTGYQALDYLLCGGYTPGKVLVIEGAQAPSDLVQRVEQSYSYSVTAWDGQGVFPGIYRLVVINAPLQFDRNLMQFFMSQARKDQTALVIVEPVVTHKALKYWAHQRVRVDGNQAHVVKDALNAKNGHYCAWN